MVVLWNFFEIERKRFLTYTTIYNHNLEIADELFECVWPFCGIGA